MCHISKRYFVISWNLHNECDGAQNNMMRHYCVGIFLRFLHCKSVADETDANHSIIIIRQISIEIVYTGSLLWLGLLCQCRCFEDLTIYVVWFKTNSLCVVRIEIGRKQSNKRSVCVNNSNVFPWFRLLPVRSMSIVESKARNYQRFM